MDFIAHQHAESRILGGGFIQSYKSLLSNKYWGQAACQRFDYLLKVVESNLKENCNFRESFLPKAAIYFVFISFIR
jgi:hypothetical protein